MADFLIRNIDAPLAERIKAVAREKSWPLNDVILHLIKTSLSLATPEPVASAAATESARDTGEISRLAGHFADDEMRAFDAAVKAISAMPNDIAHYEASPATLRRAVA